VNDFDHLVDFWNPESTCIDQRYEIEFWSLLLTCDCRYPAKHLLIEPQKNIAGSSLAPSQCASSQFAMFFRNDWIPKRPKSAAFTLWPRPDVGPSDFFLFGYLREKLHGTSFTTSHDPTFARTQIFSEIQENALKNDFTTWTTRLPWVMKNGGEYHIK
jgi:hypothetical protein